MKKWEYKTDLIGYEDKRFSGSYFNERNIENVLNEYGKEGWELVSINPMPHWDWYFVVVLKREIKDN